MQYKRQTTGQRIELFPDLEIGSGGQARIYAVPGDPGLVAKVYREPRDEYARKLAVMLANPPSDPSAAQGHASIAWPLDLLLSQDKKPRVVGYIMPRAHASTPILERYNPSLRRRECPLFNYLYLHRVARNLASVFHALHLRDYVIGDVNESNILVTDTAIVTLVDTDSFQVRDREQNSVFRCPVGRPEFTPPELQGKAFHYATRVPENDRFGLAVMIFQLLMEGTHPFAGIYTGNGDPPPYETRIAGGYFPYGAARLMYRPLPAAPPIEILPPALWELFSRCFEAGHATPAARPDAQTWVLALREAEQNLALCAVNEQHRYGNHLSACPWCARRERLGGRDPFPSQQSVQGTEDNALLTTVQASLPAAGLGGRKEEEKKRRKEENTEYGRQKIAATQPSTINYQPTTLNSQPERPSAGKDTTFNPQPTSAGRGWVVPVGLLAVAVVAGGIFVATRPHQAATPSDTNVTKPAVTNPNTRTPEHLNTLSISPLVSAINKGNDAQARTLLTQTPALAQGTGKGNWTPLHYAAYKGDAEIAQQLLKAGADVNAPEKDGYTPLHLAAQEGKTSVAQVLLKSRADVNAREKLGWTPLHFAAQEGRADIAKLLLANGADVTLLENKGLTPLAVAEKAKQTTVANLLRQNGATQ